MSADKKIRMAAATLAILLLCENAHCLNVSPGRIEVSVAPSKSYEGALMVRNAEGSAIDVKLRAEDWHKAVEGTPEEKSPSFEWLEIATLDFELEPGQTKEVKLRVSVPKDAEGEFNAMIFVDGKPKEIREGALGINTSIGIPIYVIISGTERFKAEVEDLKVVKTPPLELAVTIKNSGNAHIRPTGSIEIRNADKTALTLPLNEYNYPILPNSSRTLEIRSNGRLEPGEYTADISMGYGDRKYRKRTTLKIE